jgi:hypothetical protein
MLNYKILDYKTQITRNGETYYDLMSKSFNYTNNIEGAFLIVNKYYVARPDLISLALYGSDEYADVICKINGISNPFEINENDLIFYPNPEYLTECYKYYGDESSFIESEEDELTKREKNYQKSINETRSPNEQIVGDKNFTIDKSLGLVFY